MKSVVTVVVTITAGILISGCSLVQRAMPGSTMSDAEIIGVLNTIDHSEIDAGQLALQKASTAEVRSFASRIVSEHETMMQNTGRLAHRLNVQPQKPALASTMEDTHREAMEKLGAKYGSDFDKAYIAYQIKMHEQALGLVKDAAQSVENQSLKLHLREMRPDLQNHLVSAQSIERQWSRDSKDSEEKMVERYGLHFTAVPPAKPGPGQCVNSSTGHDARSDRESIHSIRLAPVLLAGYNFNSDSTFCHAEDKKRGNSCRLPFVEVRERYVPSPSSIA